MPIPKFVVTLALMAAQMALTASRTIEGPRLKDLDASVADYGTPLPYIYGISRVEASCFFCEPIKEKKRKRKTKGGKYKEYTYFGTWASVIADHEIARVRRIWFDNHLVYDNGASIGDDTDTVEDLDGNNASLADFIRIYTGTEDQEPDPRMLATIEANEGAGTCPAYKGVAYIFFEDVPLEKIGNRYPQVSVEVEGLQSGFSMTRRILDEGGGLSFIKVSPDADYLLGWGNSADDITVWNNISRTLAAQNFEYRTIPFTFDGDDYAGITPFAIGDDGKVYGEDFGGIGILCSFDTLGTGAITGLHNTGDLSLVNVYNLPDDTERVVAFNTFAESASAFTVWVWNVDTATMSELDVQTETGVLWAPRAIVQDTFGDVWVLGTAPNLGGNVSTVYFWRVVDTGLNPGSDFQTVTGFPTITGSIGLYTVPSIFGFYASDGSFVVAWVKGTANFRYLVKVASFAVTDTRDYGSNLLVPLDDGDKASDSITPGSATFWGFTTSSRVAIEIDAVTLDDIQSFDLDLWFADEDGDPEGLYLHDRKTNALIAGTNALDPDGLSISWRDISEGELTLADIVRDVSVRTGLEETTDFDVDDIEIPVTGYKWTQGSGRQAIDNLLALYDVDPRPHDFVVQYLRRGDAPGSTIPSTDFVPNGETRYRLSLKNDTDLPRRLYLNFADIDGDHQPNNVKAQRLAVAVDSSREQTLDMTTWTADKDEAQPLVERYFRRDWFSLGRPEFDLMSPYLGLEPADTKTIDLDGDTMKARLVKLTIAGARLKTEWEQDDPAIADQSDSVGSPAFGRPEAEIFSPGDSVGFVLDLPLLTDAHDQSAPFVYITGGPAVADATYVGTEFHQSDTGDDDTYNTWDATGSSDPATFGETTTELPDAEAGVIDNGSTLTVVLNNGSLSSVTESQLLLNAALNLALVGDELVQFKTATLTAPLTYNLSGFVRGARGTEQHMATHTTTDRFVLLDTIGLHTVGASELGDEDWYIAAAPGTSPNPANEFAVDFNGNAHKPYSPAHVTVTRVGDDWEIDGIRRTRIGGSSVNGQDVPLGETSESWEADILDGVDVVRTIDGTSLPLTYLEADAIIDFGSVPSTLDVVLYQISPALTLRGFGTEASG